MDQAGGNRTNIRPTNVQQRVVPPQSGMSQSGGARTGRGVTVDTNSIIGSGISPSAVLKGKAGTNADDPLAKYRIVQPTDEESVDWNKALRSASRAEASGAPFQADPVYTAPPATTKTPLSTHTSSTSVPTIRPSEGMRSVSSVPQTTQTPTQPNSNPNRTTAYGHQQVGVVATPTLKPSILKDQSEDPLAKYRVKSPEEEERTWVISLRNLPAGVGKPVIFLVDERQQYAGIGAGGVVTQISSILCNSETGSLFNLKVNSINFDFNRNLELGKGRFVRFGVEQGQMKFRQQKMDFDD